jgi:hypothetical protein
MGVLRLSRNMPFDMVACTIGALRTSFAGTFQGGFTLLPKTSQRSTLLPLTFCLQVFFKLSENRLRSSIVRICGEERSDGVCGKAGSSSI